jgi:UPF0755 protein
MIDRILDLLDAVANLLDGRRRRGSGFVPLFLSGVAALVLASAVYVFTPTFFRPLRKTDVPVLPGTGARQIAVALQKEGLLVFRTPFVVLSKLTGTHRRLQAGLYRMDSRMSLWGVLNVLSRGKSELLTLCVPEGFTAYQIAQLAASRNIVTAEDFMRAAESPEIAKRLGLPATRLEGFLFPETYRVPLGVGPESLVKLMVDYFRHVEGDSYADRVKRHGLTFYQAVILASIVEKEAQLESERPLIAGVMLNRLRRDMRLEVNATLNYVLDNKRAWLTREQLNIRSPYNTYLKRGLPPSPICNPGRTSLKAVAEPAFSDYLFYVALGDGSHLFAADFKDHQANIRRVKQLRRLKKAGTALPTPTP